MIRMNGENFKGRYNHNVAFDLDVMETDVRCFNEKEIAMRGGGLRALTGRCLCRYNYGHVN